MRTRYIEPGNLCDVKPIICYLIYTTYILYCSKFVNIYENAVEKVKKKKTYATFNEFFMLFLYKNLS